MILVIITPRLIYQNIKSIHIYTRSRVFWTSKSTCSYRASIWVLKILFNQKCLQTALAPFHSMWDTRRTIKYKFSVCRAKKKTNEEKMNRRKNYWTENIFPSSSVTNSRFHYSNIIYNIFPMIFLLIMLLVIFIFFL